MNKEALFETFKVDGFFSSEFILKKSTENANSAESQISVIGNQFPDTEFVQDDNGFTLKLYGKIEIIEYLDAMARLLENCDPGALLRIITAQQLSLEKNGLSEPL